MGILNKITSKIKKGEKKEEKEAKQEETKKEKKIDSKDRAKEEAKKAKKGEEKTEKKPSKEEKISKGKEYIAYRVLVRPLVTEKATNLAVYNKYLFEVTPEANKLDIKKAVKEVYGVTPIAVNIIKKKGKRVSYGRILGRRKGTKKAIVTLKKGEKIEVYEGI